MTLPPIVFGDERFTPPPFRYPEFAAGPRALNARGLCLHHLHPGENRSDCRGQLVFLEEQAAAYACANYLGPKPAGECK
jgi:hypothetical protein